MTPSAIPVAVHGFTWTAALVGLLNVLIGGALVAWIRSRPKMREIAQTADALLIETLGSRVEKLERKLDEKEAQHLAEMAIMRHRANNSDQCIDALLLLLEQSPDKVREAVAMIKEMRTRQRAEEAAEKAAYHAAAIAAASKGRLAAD